MFLIIVSIVVTWVSTYGPATAMSPSAVNRPTLKSLPSTTMGEEERVLIVMPCSSLIWSRRCLMTSKVIGSTVGRDRPDRTRRSRR